ncbi:hypothetical protein NM208_g1546 [Fusarium decemcellulare]|uniref:Uncharacterized protein n=1 Tax=Fusarium decemcellulare TaxID=57161 RepID=A0ACC1SVK1_9HYPO|nr:hypothetical protein NM208_g1546 [Fusarium decemcellulare]
MPSFMVDQALGYIIEASAWNNWPTNSAMHLANMGHKGLVPIVLPREDTGVFASLSKLHDEQLAVLTGVGGRMDALCAAGARWHALERLEQANGRSLAAN